MRLRNIRGAKEAVAESTFVVHDPEAHRGRWNEFFENHNPLYIEIGMGKGRFVTELAGRYPEINYIGIEKYESVMIRAIAKRKMLTECKNLFFLCCGAEHLSEVFGKGEIARIYLNFSDPWPKERHARRRLTSQGFLDIYRDLLAEDGRLEFKTDNNPLFDFSLEQAEQAGWELCEVTRDLHHSEYMDGNVMTEYEERFSAIGNPISRMVAYPPKR